MMLYYLLLAAVFAGILLGGGLRSGTTIAEAKTLIANSNELSRMIKDQNRSMEVYLPNDPEYMDKVVLPNFFCRSLCPHAIVLPQSTSDVAQLVKLSGEQMIPLTIRSNGHGRSFGCESAQDGGLILDLSNLDDFQISSDKATMEVGPGNTWADVLPALKEEGLIAVHPAKLDSDIFGFSIHGGFNYGGLSDFYGLGSENIAAATVVISNSSIVRVSSTKCIMDGQGVSWEKCSSLWYGLRGAGSSFGVVTSLKIRLHPRPSQMKSALAIFGLELSSAEQAAVVLQAALAQLPRAVSASLYAFPSLKLAKQFVRSHAQSRREARASRVPAGHQDTTSTAFVVAQASWLEKEEREGGGGGPPAMLHTLRAVFDQVETQSQMISTSAAARSEGNTTGKDPPSSQCSSSTSGGDKSDDCQVEEEKWGKAAAPPLFQLFQDWVLVADPFIVSQQVFSLEEKGNFYGAASVAVAADLVPPTMEAAVHRYFEHVVAANLGPASEGSGWDGAAALNPSLRSGLLGGDWGDCAECELVLHRPGRRGTTVGRGGYQIVPRPDCLSPACHAFALSVELRCKQPYRRRQGAQACLGWLDRSQTALDARGAAAEWAAGNASAVAAAPGRCHLPQNPHGPAARWAPMAYSPQGYAALREAKVQWDPHNMFRTAQTVPPAAAPGEEDEEAFPGLRHHRTMLHHAFNDEAKEREMATWDELERRQRAARWQRDHAELGAVCREAYRLKTHNTVGKELIAGSAGVALLLNLF